jgi:hypothetical protein
VPSTATWHPFGNEFENNTSANVADLETDGTRLVAAAGGNGSVFRRDPGELDWTISWLDNVGLRPGVQARQILWNGHGWVVGTIRGVSHSVGGQEPWTTFNPGLGPLQNEAFAARGRTLFAAFDFIDFGLGLQIVAIESSEDDGATWELMEFLPGAFVFRMAVARTTLYAARADGLWRRSIDTVSASGDGGPHASPLALAVVGRQPAAPGDALRLRFDLPSAADASIELYDVRGRRVVPAVHDAYAAGPPVVALDVHGLHAGVYQARVASAGHQATARVVRL